MDVDTNIDGDDEVDLLDLEQLTYLDNTYNLPIDVDTNTSGDDEVDLAWIVGEENAYPLDYYLT